MAAPFLLVQLSDPHIGGDWATPDPVARLGAAVEAVLAMPEQPNAVLVSGDLADNATDAEYEQVRELLSPLAAPTYVLPGNHDDRRALHRHFGVPGADGEPVQYSVDLGPMQLVVLDTTIPGRDAGALETDQLEWLDGVLSASDLPTLVAMHHPPLVTGVPGWDDAGLAAEDRRALGDVIGRHEQVQRVVAGHFHRVMVGRLAGRSVLTAPSTYVQMRPSPAADGIELADDEPTGFVVHTVVDGNVLSHVQPVG